MIDIGSLYTRIEADTSGLNKAETAISSFAKNAAGYFAAIASVSAGAAAVKDVTFAAGRYDALGIVMNVVGKNAGYSAQEIGKFQVQLEKTGISMTSSRETLTKMAQANIDLSNSSKLARIAQDAAVIGNINSSEAFERMIYGIQSGQIEVLKTIGINVNFENSYKKLASQLNKTTAELTEEEKMLAKTNAVMEQGPNIAGVYAAAMDSPMKKFLTLTGRIIPNLKVAFGEVFQPSFGIIVDELKTSLDKLMASMDKKSIKEWGENIKGAVEGTFTFVKAIKALSETLGTPGMAQLVIIGGVFAKFGPGAATAAAGVLTLNNALDKTQTGSIQQGIKAYNGFSESIQNLWDVVTNQRDWNTGNPINELAESIADAKIKENLKNNVSEPWKEAAAIARSASEGMEKGVKKNLDVLQKEYEQHANAIKKISDEIKENQLSGEELIRSISQSGMSDLGKWQDLKKQAQEYAAESEKALKSALAMKEATSKEDVEKRNTFFEDAAKYADLAKSKYADLKGEIKSGDQTVISQQQSIQEAIAGVRAMIDLKNEALTANKNMEANAGNAIANEINAQGGTAKLFEDIKTKSNDIITQTFPAMGAAFDKAWQDGANSANVVFTNIDQSLNKTATKVSETMWAIPANGAEGIATEVKKIGEVWTNVSESAMKGSAESTKKQTADSKDIGKEVKLIGGVWTNVWEEATKSESAFYKQAMADLERLQKEAAKVKISSASGKSSGGAISGFMNGGAIMAAAGQYFPGYGGGDKIPIMGEAGEVMIRKERQREVGVDTSLAYNRGDWRTVIQNLLPKLSMGGPVSSKFPRQAFAMGGAIQQISQDTSDSIRKYFIAGNPEPITVRADNRNGDRIFAELERKYRRRS